MAKLSALSVMFKMIDRELRLSELREQMQQEMQRIAELEQKMQAQMSELEQQKRKCLFNQTDKNKQQITLVIYLSL